MEEKHTLGNFNIHLFVLGKYSYFELGPSQTMDQEAKESNKYSDAVVLILLKPKLLPPLLFLCFLPLYSIITYSYAKGRRQVGGWHFGDVSYVVLQHLEITHVTFVTGNRKEKYPHQFSFNVNNLIYKSLRTVNAFLVRCSFLSWFTHTASCMLG